MGRKSQKSRRANAIAFNRAQYALGCGAIDKRSTVSMALEATGWSRGEMSRDEVLIAFVEWVKSGVSAADKYNSNLIAGMARKKARAMADKERKSRPAVQKKPQTNMATLRAAGIPPIGDPHADYTDPKAFYATDEWKKIRYSVMVRSSGKCSCCGASAKTGATLQVDHIIPRWKDPSKQFDVNNLQVLCGDCNSGKGAWDSTDWRLLND